MSDERSPRTIVRRLWDRYLPVVAAISMPVGIILGLLIKVGAAYQRVNDDHDKIAAVFTWKETQEDFNVKTAVAIAKLEATIERMK